MSNPYIGEIRMFGGNFAPQGWALCNGQQLSITENTALFSILGTQFGGNGIVTFGLPDLRGRVPIHQGAGTGLSPYIIGEFGGAETTTLSVNQLPAHNHFVNASSSIGTLPGPGNNIPASVSGAAAEKTYSASTPNAVMSAGMIGISGGGQPVSTVQPFLCINFIIALVGIFPARD